MITITYTNFMAAIGLFTALCVAAGWLIKIIKAMKKPSDDIHKMLDNNNKRIKALEDAVEELMKVHPMLLRANYVMLKHMRTNNSTGEIAEQENAINEYLFNR